MENLMIEEKQMFSEVIKERVIEIKTDKLQYEWLTPGIINLLHMSDNHLLDEEETLPPCIVAIFGLDKQVINENVNNIMLMQKLSLILLNELLMEDLITDASIEQLKHELLDATSDNVEVSALINKTMQNLNLKEPKLNLDEMIKKIEQNRIDEEPLYSLLTILSEIDPKTILLDSKRKLLKMVINKNIIQNDFSQPLKEYLMTISRMDNLIANKLLFKLKLTAFNPVINALVESLTYASNHQELQKKFQFSVEKLKEIASRMDVDENYTLDELFTILLNDMIIQYKKINNEVSLNETVIEKSIKEEAIDE